MNILILFLCSLALKITINQVIELSIDMIKINFGQAREVCIQKRTSGWHTRFLSLMLTFLISCQKAFKALQSLANLSSKFMIQVCFNMLIINMRQKLYKLKLVISLINTIINQRYIPSIKIRLKNKFSILLRSFNQVDSSK